MRQHPDATLTAPGRAGRRPGARSGSSPMVCGGAVAQAWGHDQHSIFGWVSGRPPRPCGPALLRPDPSARLPAGPGVPAAARPAGDLRRGPRPRPAAPHRRRPQGRRRRGRHRQAPRHRPADRARRVRGAVPVRRRRPHRVRRVLDPASRGRPAAAAAGPRRAQPQRRPDPRRHPRRRPARRAVGLVLGARPADPGRARGVAGDVPAQRLVCHRRTGRAAARRAERRPRRRDPRAALGVRRRHRPVVRRPGRAAGDGSEPTAYQPSQRRPTSSRPTSRLLPRRTPRSTCTPPRGTPASAARSCSGSPWPWLPWPSASSASSTSPARPSRTRPTRPSSSAWSA